MADVPVLEAIEIDQPCTSCGYNLRGLRQVDRCPECGTEVAVSLRGDLLRFANPVWLRAVLRGADLAYYSILLGIVARIIVRSLASSLGMFSVRLSILLAVVAALLQTIAVWLMTTQEPRVTFTERQITWRRVLRFCAVTNLVLLTLAQSSLLGMVVSLGPVVTVAVSVAQVCSGVVATYGYFAYAEGFAHRIPDARLARSTKIVKWGLTTVGLVSLVGILMWTVVGSPIVTKAAATGGASTPGVSAPAAGSPAVAPKPTPPAPAPAAMPVPKATIMTAAIFGCATGLAYLVFGLWALGLLSRYRKALRLAIDQSTSGV